jgi:hypothetical protein
MAAKTKKKNKTVKTTGNKGKKPLKTTLKKKPAKKRANKGDKPKKKPVKTAQIKKKPTKKTIKASKPRQAKTQLILPKKLTVPPKPVIIVYGMRIDPENITRMAIEAYNKHRYTVHDLRLTECISDPKFRNLMVKIAVLDRVEEEILRLYPQAQVLRPNTVTVMVN